MGTSWGLQAIQNAEALGVNPSTLAATCLVESNCENIGGSGSVSGAFQMTNAIYLQDINQAVGQNPALTGVDTSLAGKLDPANEAIAAAQDLKNAAAALQNAGVSNPTFTDARAFYQWGAGAGPQVALSSDSANLSQILTPYYTPAQLAANGVTSTTTVGQWRQSFASKVGSAANQSVRS
jgi:hypothetical protein